jgi:mono/diheme cytochrome c family protein
MSIPVSLVVFALGCGSSPSPKEPEAAASAAAAPSAAPSAASSASAATSEPAASASAAPGSSAAASAAPAASSAPAAPMTLAAMVDAGDVATGKKLYDEQHCNGCHGTSDKPSKKFPNLFKVDWTKSGEIDHAFAIIKKGDAPMPPYGDNLDDKQIASIVAFLRAK